MTNSNDIFVVDDKGMEVLWDTGKIGKHHSPKSIVLAPEKPFKSNMEAYGSGLEVLGAPEQQLVSGKTYRLDIGFSNADHTIVYRQREYVTIP